MTQHNPDIKGKAASSGRPDGSEGKEKIAGLLPFMLRAWWMRDFKDYEEIEWHTEMSITAPLWSWQSDPLCDQGNMDFGDETP